MRVAYLINQYPLVSHSFIRREILALEAIGISVTRVSLRRTGDGTLVDPVDRAENSKTIAILDQGKLGLLGSFLRLVVARPIQLLRAIILTLRCGYRSHRGMVRHLVYLLEACALLRVINRCNCNHVHAHFGTNATMVAMLANALGGPSYTFTVHGPEEFDSPYALSLREKVSRAAAVVAISSFCKSQLMRWCDCRDWGKLHIVRCGVDGDFFQPDVQSPSQEPTLLFVGRLCEQKGPLLLIEAAARLHRDDVPFQLVLLGDGELRSELEQRILELGIGRVVVLKGASSGADVRHWITRSRALVLPSFAEGLPVVLMEAMALGRPVISTFVAGIPELVVDGETGWLVWAGDVDRLSTAMKQALDCPPSKLHEMGMRGQSRVKLLHDVAQNAKRLATVFRLQHDNVAEARS